MTNAPKSIDTEALSKVSGGQQATGGAGADTINTGQEADLVFGREGSDRINTGSGDDQAHGEGGDDVIYTGDGNDLVFGGEGNDLIMLSSGNDQGQGGAGQDTILGGDGSDQLFGGDGNDVLDGGVSDHAADYVEGGAGDDSFVWTPRDGNDTFQGGTGQDTVRLPGVTLHELQTGLNLWTPNVTMQVDSKGLVSFMNPQGQAVSFSGQLTIGGATFTFQDVEKLTIAV